MPTYRVSLASPVFLEEVRALKRRHPDLVSRITKRLEHVVRDPVGLGDRLQDDPRCFKTRVGADFRLIYTVRGECVIPVMVYAKNHSQDVDSERLVAAMDAILRQAAGDAP